MVVEPVPADEGDSPDGLTGGLEADGGPKHKKDAVADSDGEAKGTGETAPVGTGLEGTCDADGDGVQDATCTSPGTSTTGIEQTPEPAQPAVKPRPKRPAKAKGPAAVKRPAAKRSGSKK